jgi:ribonucleoside-diphosphate reductase alpha chain
MTGMMDNPDVLFDPDTLEAGAAIVGAVNEEVAEAIGISPAARTTCVKPEGKSSLMLDTLAAGIHPWPGKRGIRHVRASVMETPFQHFKEHNPHAVFLLAETDPNRDNTEVIAFPFEAPEGALTKADVSAIDLLERVILVRKHWVEPGTYPDRCVRPWLRHNVSNTIHVEPDEWADVTEFVFEHRAHFAGVAMLPAAGDKFYDLAPNVTVHTPDEQRSIYGDRAVEMAIALVASLPGSFGGLWPAVSAAISNGQHRFFDGTEAEAAWMEAFEQFASVHFDSDLRAAEVCVKERECWERYLFLRDAYKPVDWADMVEANDDVDFVANAGGCDGVKCEIDFSTMPGAGAK